MEQQPESSNGDIVDFIFDRIVLWIVFGAFGVAIGMGAWTLLDRTDGGSHGNLAGFIGLMSAAALYTLAELIISVRSLVEGPVPSPADRLGPWPDEEETTG